VKNLTAVIGCQRFHVISRQVMKLQ